LRPLAVSTASFYRQNKTILDRELEHLADTARVVGARYWLVAPDDFHLESGDEFLQKATSGLLDQAPAVFATPGGRVRIYDISALTGSVAGPSERSGSEDGSQAWHSCFHRKAAFSAAAGMAPFLTTRGSPVRSISVDGSRVRARPPSRT
jgi:hypothetical protein